MGSHDASPNKSSGALFGFVGIPAKARAKMGQDAILKLVADQLVKLFGNEAKNVNAILDKDWSGDSETAVEEDCRPLKNYQSYGQLPVEGIWKRKVIFAGTETLSECSGHLEGALRSAEQAVF